LSSPNQLKPDKSSNLRGRPTGGRTEPQGAGVPKSSHSPFSVMLFFAGRAPLSRPRLLLARCREVLTGVPAPPTIAVRGMGADPHRSHAVSGTGWSSLRIGQCCLARRLASRPTSIRSDSGPQARCSMGSLVLVGRCHLSGDLVDQDADRSQPQKRRLCLTSMPASAPFLHVTIPMWLLRPFLLVV
jgi:hypothetical protein